VESELTILLITLIANDQNVPIKKIKCPVLNNSAPNQTAEKGCFSMKKESLDGERENKSLLMRLSENGHFKLFIWIPDQVGNDKPVIIDSSFA